MYERTIICLANSRKPPSGRCVAGKEYKGARIGQWIRPVSSRPDQEVSEEERRYESGKKAKLLDIVTIPLEHHSPIGHQVENHVLADDYYWTKEGVAAWDQIRALADPYDGVFWVNTGSTYYGLNDKVPDDVAANIGSSLKLIILPNLEVVVRLEEGYQGLPGRRRVRARFDLKGTQYLLSVTDPEVEEKFLLKGNGTYDLENVALCISLGGVWNGYAFRLVASVITSDQCKA